MLGRPRLRACFQAAIVEPALLLLRSEHSELVFEGSAYVALAPLLDGRHTISEILAEAGRKVPWTSLYAALATLERKGCLAEGEGLDDKSATAFWDYLGVDPQGAASALGHTPLSVRVLGGLSDDHLRRAFDQAGFAVTPDGELTVVATPDYLLPELMEINEAGLTRSRSWLLVKPLGTVIWVGPLIRPGITGCWECLVARLQLNRQVEHYLIHRGGRGAPVHVTRARLESTERLGAVLAAAELARALATPAEDTVEGRVRTFDLVSREVGLHALVRRPQCAACGSRRLEPERGPVVLDPQPKPSVGGPTARAKETYERYKHHVSPITGIVTSLTARDTDEQGLTHNYVAGHYFPTTSDGLRTLRLNLVARAGGKGSTDMQARAGALCEALERYSGIAWGDEQRVVASYDALRGEAVHIRELALFSDAQYANRDLIKPASDYHEVPPPLDERTPISWTRVWSLSRNRPLYLPTGYCYYGFRDPGQFFTRCDSNGCAAGSSLEQAVLNGLLELVERDSVAIWWYNRLSRPALDVASFRLPYWDRLEEYYRDTLDRELHALDLTADLGIPAVAVVSRRRHAAVEDIIVGFAAHLDPAVALLRALLEVNQYLPSVREKSSDGSTRYRFSREETLRWWMSATYANQPYLVPDPEAPPRRASDFPLLATDDYKKDVEVCLRAAERAGLEVLVLDQSRPDVGLPVARVLVPGLRHFWRRLAPGRLYDVPVELGWLARPLPEDELNPVSCFV